MVRAARNAVALRLDSVAEMLGVHQVRVAAALRALPPRGRCAELAAAMAQDLSVEMSDAGVGHRACPPALLRVDESMSDSATVGSAGWGWRHDGSRTAARAVLAQVSHNVAGGRSAARHPLCPPAILTRLAAVGGSRTRSLVASNLNCDRVALVKLSIDENNGVAFNATANPHCLPVQLLGPTRHSGGG